MSTLELRSVSKVYGRGAAEVQALRDVSLTVKAGEMVAVMGPSGSGKSSLLTIAGTLEEPTSGAVLVNGKDTLRMSGGAKSQLFKATIGYVFQDFNLLLHLHRGGERVAAARAGRHVHAQGAPGRAQGTGRARPRRPRQSLPRPDVRRRAAARRDRPRGGGGAVAAARRRAVRRARHRERRGRHAADPQLLQARHRRRGRHARRAARLLGGPDRVPARRPPCRPDRGSRRPGDAAGAVVAERDQGTGRTGWSASRRTRAAPRWPAARRPAGRAAPRRARVEAA